MKTTYLRLFLGLTVAIVLFTSCGGKRGKGAASADEMIFSVRTAVAETKDLRAYIDTNGNVEAAKQIEVYPDMGGKLISLSVVLGSRVRKGQVIAEVDPSTPGARFARSPVYAPISGAIASVPLQIGTTVSVNNPVVTIGDTDNLQISSYIPERYIGVLKTGLDAILKVEAYPNEEFAITVVRVSPVVDATSRTKQIHFELDKTDPRINAGMYAKIRLYTQTIENAITIPSSAIVVSYGENYVFVANDDSTVTRRAVKIGATAGNDIQILEGITSGDKVIVQGQQVLTDGAKVQEVVTNTSNSTN
ncbi:MAG: efflux RND transporter periplasmic adaptor subunit [Treponemataceae bacterium]